MINEKLFPSVTPEENKKLKRLCRRQNMWSMAWEQVSGQAKGIVYTLSPFLEEIYEDDQEELISAYERHFKYFNTSPTLGSFIIGLIYAMEKQRGKDRENMSASTISDIRVSLCGPLAGIGDSLIQNVFKVIIAGLTMTMAAQGNILGPILFVLVYGFLQIGIMNYLTYLGYTTGTSVMDKLLHGGLLSSVTKSVTIVGLFMVGALTAAMVSFRFNWIIDAGGATVNIQEIIDKIFPGLLAIVLTFIVSALLKKRVKVSYIVYGIMVICLVFAFLGIV